MDYKPRNFKLPRGDALERQNQIDPYVFSESTAIAVDIALTIGRPLLVAGKPGCGKSRLAEAMAAVLKWDYLDETITSRTRLEELTVEIDHLRRLHDAQTRAEDAAIKPDWAYYNPGLFWWAFDSESARHRGAPGNECEEPLRLEFQGTTRISKPPGNIVLLIDEIDKAQPDLPNDLLEPLDRRSFRLPNGQAVEADEDRRILTIITTNGERRLPLAFLRRCVSLTIDEPEQDTLETIARYHFPDANRQRVASIAEKIIEFRAKAENLATRPPGTSEFLDAVDACEKLDVDLNGSIWKHIESAVLTKDSKA